LKRVLDERALQTICQNVAKALKEERLRQNLSMTELAQRAGLSQQMVSYMERGMRTPTIDTLLRVTSVLGVPLWKFLKNSENA
jgi:transcriptional regulator with XRE-family HTH domain